MKTCLVRVLVLGGLVLTVAWPAGADVESAALAKYKKPVEAAVDKGLAFLAKNQIPPGQPLAGSFVGTLRGNPGITSLCIMAFLSKGHTPGSGPYGDVINHGIDYVLGTFRAKDNLLIGPDGSPGGLMYVHCMSTLMLAEASGMVDPERQGRIDAVLPKALNLIVAAQRVPKPPSDAGGWRYSPASADSDISQTGWAVMALRAARLNGAAIPKECIEKAVQYVLKLRMADGGFVYRPGDRAGTGLARTGVGVLVLELCGQHGNPATIAGGEYILRVMPRKTARHAYCFYYSEYYASQAMFQLGGKYWETWAPVMYDLLLGVQLPDGSWPPELDAHAAEAPGPAYATAMAVLAMTPPYRQLPIYQR